MRVLIAGSRNYRDMEGVRSYVRKLPPGSVVISGDEAEEGAAPANVDQTAIAEARRLGLKVEVYRPEWDRYGRAAGPRRNSEMLAQGIERVTAFWDGTSRGTADTIRKARRMGLPLEIIT